MIRAGLLPGLLLASATAFGADAVSTVGSVTENNGLSKNGWLLVKTPSILRVTGSEPVTPELREALEQYDRIQELSGIDPAIRAEALRRSADLRIRLAESGEMDAAELDKALRAYRALLAEQPDYVRADRVLYQMARASELRGDEAQAIASLQQLGRQYPQSARRADAQFRAAELLYPRPPLRRGRVAVPRGGGAGQQDAVVRAGAVQVRLVAAAAVPAREGLAGVHRRAGARTAARRTERSQGGAGRRAQRACRTGRGCAAWHRAVARGPGRRRGAQPAVRAGGRAALCRAAACRIG